MLIFVKLQSSLPGFNNNTNTQTDSVQVEWWLQHPQRTTELVYRWHGDGSLEEMAAARPQLSSLQPARAVGSGRTHKSGKSATSVKAKRGRLFTGSKGKMDELIRNDGADDAINKLGCDLLMVFLEHLWLVHSQDSSLWKKGPRN